MITLEHICGANVPHAADDVAVHDGQRTLTRGEWQERACDLITILNGIAPAHNPDKPRRALVLSENRADLFPFYTALSAAGISASGVDVMSAPAQIEFCADLIEAELLVYSGTFADRALAVLHRRPTLRGVCVDDLPADPGPAPTVPTSKWPFESIAFTSGTTGMPKAARRTRPFDARRFEALTRMFGFNAEDVFLPAMPFSHASAPGWIRLFLSIGGRVVLADPSDISAVARIIVDERVTAVLLPPCMLDHLVVEFSGRRCHDLDALRFVLTGGKHLPRDLARRAIECFGPVIHEYYGTTETGLNALATSADLTDFPGSAGRLFDETSALILAPDGYPAPDGVIGRVAIHSYQNMDGYVGGVAAETCDHAGSRYLVTADYGCVRAGRIFLANRTTDRSTTIDLYALEDALRSVPGVADAFAMYGGGRRVEAFVTVRETETTARQPFEARVAALAAVFGGIDLLVRRVERIPYTSAGKVRILKHTLP